MQYRGLRGSEILPAVEEAFGPFIFYSLGVRKVYTIRIPNEKEILSWRMTGLCTGLPRSVVELGGKEEARRSSSLPRQKLGTCPPMHEPVKAQLHHTCYFPSPILFLLWRNIRGQVLSLLYPTPLVAPLCYPDTAVGCSLSPLHSVYSNQRRALRARVDFGCLSSAPFFPFFPNFIIIYL